MKLTSILIVVAALLASTASARDASDAVILEKRGILANVFSSQHQQPASNGNAAAPVFDGFGRSVERYSTTGSSSSSSSSGGASNLFGVAAALSLGLYRPWCFQSSHVNPSLNSSPPSAPNSDSKNPKSNLLQPVANSKFSFKAADVGAPAANDVPTEHFHVSKSGNSDSNSLSGLFSSKAQSGAASSQQNDTPFLFRASSLGLGPLPPAND
ncbi:hypothetical protein HDU76_009920, partial [Blyttiomyces sp. JEL0837]